jgi:hypothetical protein
LTRLKIAVFSPIPSVRVITARSVNPGEFAQLPQSETKISHHMYLDVGWAAIGFGLVRISSYAKRCRGFICFEFWLDRHKIRVERRHDPSALTGQVNTHRKR